jgi:hypothetical protein
MKKGTGYAHAMDRASRIRFTLQEISDAVCQFTDDGKKTTERDVLDWYHWLERRCGLRTSLIFSGRITMTSRKVGDTLILETQQERQYHDLRKPSGRKKEVAAKPASERGKSSGRNHA